MADVTLTDLTTPDQLGITGLHFHVLDLAAGEWGEPEHASEEEVYAILAGSGTLHAGQDEIALAGDALVRVGADQRHRVVAGPDGLRLLAVATTSGRSYVVFDAENQPEVGGG